MAAGTRRPPRCVAAPVEIVVTQVEGFAREDALTTARAVCESCLHEWLDHAAEMLVPLPVTALLVLARSGFIATETACLR
jgi:hypothetical protein